MEGLGVACFLAGNFWFKPMALPATPDDSRLYFLPRAVGVGSLKPLGYFQKMHSHQPLLAGDFCI